MPQTRHVERHFTAGETVRDIVIGMSDGLTVPFALAAGLTGAINSAGIIVTAGLAPIAPGSVALGLRGFFSGQGECPPLPQGGGTQEPGRKKKAPKRKSGR